jgi:primosomal protein N' (replication factor Y)
VKHRFADVAVELPLEGSFVYSIPDCLDVAVGSRVLVPFARRRVTGYVIAVHASFDTVKGVEGLKKTSLKAIIDTLDPAPLFGAKRLKFYRWLSSYYFAPLGTVLSLIHPPDASLKSYRYVAITDKGKDVLEAPEKYVGSKGDLEVLVAAQKSVRLTTVERKFAKGKGRLPVNSIVARLSKAGLLSVEVKLKSGVATKVESFVELAASTETSASNRQEIESGLSRAPSQARIISYLGEHGRSPVAALRAGHGGIDGAIKSLEKKGLVTVSKERVYRDPSKGIRPKAAAHTPNSEQANAIGRIVDSISSGGFSSFLLYGVTGSGKTLVYLKALEKVVESGGRAIFLVPETALAQWPVAYLAEKFPRRVAVVHSALSAGERLDEWQRIVDGEADIVVGARSALFAPVKNLKLIIVDEEHEGAYKQEEGVKYHGRDSALMLAKTLGVTVVLGSATPSVETFYNAGAGLRDEPSDKQGDKKEKRETKTASRAKIELLTLRKRATGAKLPGTEIVDMRGKKGLVLSAPLATGLKQVVGEGHQVILLLNRRGFSSSILCRDCGRTFECLNCSVTLTLHKRRRALVCHYCDFTIPAPKKCPDCFSEELVEPGMGTERLEEEVRALLPEARVARMDRDTTRAKGATAKIIEAMESREADVLVGTQMVSKGHHFPGTTLVGIVAGDTSLTLPDFRASERTFQLVTQAAGRAGRGEVDGRVVIQTLNPDHYAFLSAAEHDYDAFYAEEIVLREEVGYPPFMRLCSVRVEAIDEARAESAAKLMGSVANATREARDGTVEVLGPIPAFLARAHGRYRWQLLLKAASASALHSCTRGLKSTFEFRVEKGVTLTVDVDPITIL